MINWVDHQAHVVEVTLLYAPASWLTSKDQVVEVPVRCIVVLYRRRIKVDRITPLGPLPPELTADANEGTKSYFLRRAFVQAAQCAVKEYLGCEVTRIATDRVDWDGPTSDEGGYRG